MRACRNRNILKKTKKIVKDFSFWKKRLKKETGAVPVTRISPG
jgi:hypothetical protein